VVLFNTASDESTISPLRNHTCGRNHFSVKYLGMSRAWAYNLQYVKDWGEYTEQSDQSTIVIPIDYHHGYQNIMLLFSVVLC